MQTEKNHALENAKAHAESIAEMVQDYNRACSENNDYLNPDDILDSMYETPLCIEYRSEWFQQRYDASDFTPSEYRITLTTGGPACQIVGTLNEYGEPDTAEIQYQDWGTPWTRYRPLTPDGSEIDTVCEAALLDFARLVATWHG